MRKPPELPESLIARQHGQRYDEPLSFEGWVLVCLVAVAAIIAVQYLG